MGGSKYSKWDFFFTCLGLVFSLVDIVLDICAVVSFYTQKNYVCLGILVVFLVGSSVLVHAYSWLWYSYDKFERNTKVENCLTPCQLKLLHVFQLGIYIRHAGVMELSLRRLFSKDPNPADFAVTRSHDLRMLRIIETFSENSPQFILMLTVTLQQGEVSPMPVLRVLMSALAIVISVTTYHRSLCSFLPDKEKQGPLSLVVSFSWILMLIVSRFTALALFASVLPCFIFTHFFCSWLVLFFFVWRSKTDFMESTGGEWLYRATVGFIWYFNWFNVADGKTRNRTMLYHGYMLVDITILCSLWYWKMTTDPPYFIIPQLYAIITAVSIVVVYIFGLLCKIMYYKFLNPNFTKDELKDSPTQQRPEMSPEDMKDVEMAVLMEDTMGKEMATDHTLSSPAS